MISRIYIEEEVRDHPRARAICRRLPRAQQISCRRWGEVFNPRAQNFRLQKRQPALILARKFGSLVLETPTGYGIGGRRNFYFSHMVNCIYDCRYCFLQGMYRSANYLLFVNYEEFQAEIAARIGTLPGDPAYFFSGYDCDSLALDSLTGFVDSFLAFFARHPLAWLELRTKSVQIRTLLDRAPLPNCVVAFSFTPEAVHRAVEHGVPSIERRLAAMARLQEKGWRLGLRFDPLILHRGWQEGYRQLFERLFSRLRATSLHSVSLGPFRLPRDFHRRMLRLYPDDGLLAGALAERRGMVSYSAAVERQMRDFCMGELERYVDRRRLYPCATDAQADGSDAEVRAGRTPRPSARLPY